MIKTYDAFYESAELPFFKKRAEALKDGDTRKKVTNSVLEGIQPLLEKMKNIKQQVLE